MDRHALGLKKLRGKKRIFGSALAVPICIFFIFISGALAEDEDVYTIEVDIPSEGAQNVEVSITIPPGLIYDDDKFDATPDTDNRSCSSPNDGSQEVCVNLDFGTVNNDITIELGLLVANTLENQDGVNLQDIRAILRYENDTGSEFFNFNLSGYVGIVEPDLIVTIDDNHPEPLDEDTQFTYFLNIEHSPNSHADAFDINITDFWDPVGMAFVEDSASDEDLIVDNTSMSIEWNIERINLDENKVLSFDVIMIDKKVQKFVNRVDYSWASAPSGYPEVRNGSDGLGGLNDYSRNVSSEINTINFSIIKIDDPDPVISGGVLKYTIIYYNNGWNPAKNVIVRETYDKNITFINSTPENDTDLDWYWTCESSLPRKQPKEDPKQIDIWVRVNKSLPNETLLENKVNVTCLDGPIREATITTTVICPNISIVKEAFNSSGQETDFVEPGDKFYYNITLDNFDQINATNVTVTDILDPCENLTYNASGTFPAHSFVDGKTLFWNASVLGSEQFNVTDDPITIKISVDLDIGTPLSFINLTNKYKFDTNEIDGEDNYLVTNVSHTVFISKVAEKDKYSP